MNEKIRKFAVLQAICLSVIASSAAGAFAAEFGDTEDHWAAGAIDTWSDREIILGYDGLFRPDDTVTRGELAVMLDRIMGYEKTAENVYSDLGDTWYTDAVLRLAAHGIMQGYESEMRPEAPVTREEAAVMLARALEISSEDAEKPAFDDAADISDWAAQAVYAMAEKGYVNGFEDNTFRPGGNMSRAEFVTVINNMIKGFYTEPGTYTADEKLSGIVIVNTGDVVLENMEIDGDLILAPGVGEGVVTLKNTTVSGEMITLGGSVYEEETENEDTDEEKPETSPAPTAAPGGSGGSSGGSSGGISSGGSSTPSAAENVMIVNSGYEGKTGRVVYGSRRYTIGSNAFSDLKSALEKAEQLDKEAQITLLSDISSEETLEIKSSGLTLDGKNHTVEFAEGVKDGIQAVNAESVTIKSISVKMQDETEKWNGSYGVQAYGASKVTFKDVNVSGADGGMLVNGAEVTLEGTIDVSGNEFGGIEVSKGSGVESMPKLKGDAKLVNESESATNPTVWIDKVSEITKAAVELEGLTELEMKEKDQLYFFVNGMPEEMQAEAATAEELADALADPEIKLITITGTVEAGDVISIDRDVMIKGGETAKSVGAGIVFDNTDGIEIVNAGNVTIEGIRLEVKNNEEGWQGIYGVQAYGASEVTFKNVSVSGADGGILVNGADVTLEGTIDVSGNEFGGIEVSKGSGVETMPALDASAAELANGSETASNPTIWIDKVSELGENVVTATDMFTVKPSEKDQLYFFIDEANAPETETEEETDGENDSETDGDTESK